MADTVKYNFEDARTTYTPCDIMDVQYEFGMKISYATAWKINELALKIVRGSPNKSYGLLLSYCWELQCTNLGTITVIHTDSQHHFKYCFHGARCMASPEPEIRNISK